MSAGPAEPADAGGGASGNRDEATGGGGAAWEVLCAAARRKSCGRCAAVPGPEEPVSREAPDGVRGGAEGGMGGAPAVGGCCGRGGAGSGEGVGCGGGNGALVETEPPGARPRVAESGCASGVDPGPVSPDAAEPFAPGFRGGAGGRGGVVGRGGMEARRASVLMHPPFPRVRPPRRPSGRTTAHGERSSRRGRLPGCPP
ncbi:hypothetical protein FNH08_33575 [Streptomyces spongiae]|uniref:Uncharacterized protein n=1 Tax=Streptomyces spongiae TaxID=565072 RepID=A0A5N8XRA4_9ACTN|nr:hypothetical protein [Streptomyces spongiae]